MLKKMIIKCSILYHQFTKAYHTIMKACLLILLIVFGEVLATPYELMKFSLSSYLLPNQNLKMEMQFVVPRYPGLYPTILYLTGLSGLTPAYFQQNLIDSIAQQGSIYLTISKLQSIDPQHMTNVAEKVIKWVNQYLQIVLNNRVPGVVADLDNKFVLIGHSAANHVFTEYLNSTCGNVKLQILLDPVDGTDPWGIKKDFIITPGKFLPYSTPSLILATQLDPVRRETEIVPCAPANLSNLRFYDAMSGPKWFLNVSKYGHIDFFNSEQRDIAGLFCASCKLKCDFNSYRTLVKDVVINFMRAILDRNLTALSIIQQAKFDIPTSFKHNRMGYDIANGGFCVRTPKINLSFDTDS